MHRFLHRTRIAGLLAVAVLAAGCSFVGARDDGGDTVTLVTHDSFAVDEAVLAAFERRSGLDVEIRRAGDAGALANELVLTEDAPIGDVAFGIDSTFASRTLNQGVFTPYRPRNGGEVPQRYSVDPKHRLTAVDVGNVCVNVDKRWFAEHHVPEPTSLRDLTEPRYRGLFVVPSPVTSSPGLAFLLDTVTTFGEHGWRDYWRDLVANDVRVSAGWQEAYKQDFSGSGGRGDRPIVLSYASSPTAETRPDGSSRTRALLGTCYRQVEYAGVLSGARHPEAARRVVDFLLSRRFQEQVPRSMYVYPAVRGVPVPESWSRVAPPPRDPAELDARRVERDRQRWVRQWRELVKG